MLRTEDSSAESMMSVECNHVAFLLANAMSLSETVSNCQMLSVYPPFELLWLHCL
jgi:hypothetical protein